MANSKAPLPDAKELILTDHYTKKVYPDCEKRDFFNKILQTGGR
jgi:hypothetical protein